ncbi:hypothetical protein NX722_21635 [Endozoicomonas gorgoniicola]|uniref:Uncharacterized protein n=1 Tax=Endozoicomonas gorgoniicola TaxID=1234144 RepID=A0ABT3N0P0_9GAMM|nr:hypothetical protein [Endozoicomonas gorgoniicola]MCW7555180.1 hypothetical protein [Endozoicomonas gorgoniicola]
MANKTFARLVFACFIISGSVFCQPAMSFFKDSQLRCPDIVNPVDLKYKGDKIEDYDTSNSLPEMIRLLFQHKKITIENDFEKSDGSLTYSVYYLTTDNLLKNNGIIKTLVCHYSSGWHNATLRFRFAEGYPFSSTNLQNGGYFGYPKYALSPDFTYVTSLINSKVPIVRTDLVYLKKESGDILPIEVNDNDGVVVTESTTINLLLPNKLLLEQWVYDYIISRHNPPLSRTHFDDDITHLCTGNKYAGEGIQITNEKPKLITIHFDDKLKFSECNVIPYTNTETEEEAAP